jgi:hypothetical protein
VEFLLVLIIGATGALGFLAVAGKIAEMRKFYLEERGQASYSIFLAIFTLIPAVLFLLAGVFDMLPARIYFWLLFLTMLWLTLRHERLRHRLAGHDPKSFVPLLTEKLAESSGWASAGAALGLLLLYTLMVFTPGEIGGARKLLTSLMELLKFLKVGGGATILMLGGALIAQWRLPQWKAKLDRLWSQWKTAQKYLKWELLLMTSLFCFSYTATFKGGSVTPLMQKIELVEKNYRDMVWRAEIELSANLRIEAYSEVYDSASPQLQVAMERESATGQRAAQIPGKYLPANFVGYRGQLPDEFRSKSDDTISSYDQMLEEENQTDHLDVPDDLPMAGEVMREGSVSMTDGLQVEPAPAWFAGLPGDLEEKIVDRTLAADNISFVEDFSHEFPLIGCLIGTVDERLNAALTEKMKAAAARVAHRWARSQVQDVHPERESLASLIPTMAIGATLKTRLAESRAIEGVVDKAMLVADADLRTAVHEELAEVVARELRAQENPQPQDETTRQANEKTVQELTEKYRYEYLLKIREDPSSAYRASRETCCAGRELFEEHEVPMPRPRPEPIIPHEYVP